MTWRCAAILAVALLAGCAAKRAPHRVAAGTPATSPVELDRAALPLAAILPAPVLPATQPATSPSAPAPLEAIDLYARARASLLDNQRFTAINLLERAAVIDPQSFEIQYALGRAYLLAGMSDRSLAAFHRAADLQPENLTARAEVGRAYFNRGDLPHATEQFRIARLTEEYRHDDATAMLVDYRLALSLQKQGYDRAALEVYEDVLGRMQRPGLAMRANPEVSFLLSRPDAMLADVALLYERQGQLDEALEAARFVAAGNPDDLAAQARVARLLARLGHASEARSLAAAIVRQFRGSPDALAVLKDVYRLLNRESDVTKELQKLHNEIPDDRGILFALADTLDSAGRFSDAETLLVSAAAKRGGDPEVIARLVDFYTNDGQIARAAAMLIETAAKRPDRVAEYEPIWERLLAPDRVNALRLEQIRAVAVAADASAAKLYYEHRVADAWSRQMPSTQALRRAVAIDPPFPPAYRALAARILQDSAMPQSMRAARTRELSESARAHGAVALADEIEAMRLLAQKQIDPAIKLLIRATEASPPAEEAELLLASAYRAAGNHARFEQLLWKLIGDHPQFAETYAPLMRHYLDQGQLSAARRVLGAWQVNIPQSVDARLLEATLQYRVAGHRDEAGQTLAELVHSYPGDARVLANARAFYTEVGKPSEFTSMLETEVARRPWNYVALAQLVDVYEEQNRAADAARALDVARTALAGDAERLYLVSQLYQRADQPRMVEQVLEESLRADPTFAPAANDLGYSWADAGQNLARAEALLRVALQQEPSNPMYLDSLGWAMYKLGRFEEARKHLEQAVIEQGYGDPVVLDHLGDALYQLDQKTAALDRWKESAAQLGEAETGERPDERELRLELGRKIRQSEAGEAVSVSPVSQRALSPKQAQN